VKRGEGTTSSPELSLLKIILPLAYLLGRHLGFFHNGLFGAAPYFTAGLFWIKFHFFL